VKYFTGKQDEGPLVEEVAKLNEALQANGPYIGGEKICCVDLALSPKLRHMNVACGHYKGLQVPEEGSAVMKYMKLMEKRDSFKQTFYPDDFILEGWKSKLPSSL